MESAAARAEGMQIDDLSKEEELQKLLVHVKDSHEKSKRMIDASRAVKPAAKKPQSQETAGGQEEAKFEAVGRPRQAAKGQKQQAASKELKKRGGASK
eukprot:COSAG02_NODE_6495_length_3537_cov_23.871728_3_plen_98_part_00